MGEDYPHTWHSLPTIVSLGVPVLSEPPGTDPMPEPPGAPRPREPPWGTLSMLLAKSENHWNHWKSQVNFFLSLTTDGLWVLQVCHSITTTFLWVVKFFRSANTGSIQLWKEPQNFVNAMRPFSDSVWLFRPLNLYLDCLSDLYCSTVGHSSKDWNSDALLFCDIGHCTLHFDQLS